MKIMWLIFALLAALSAGMVVTLSKAGIKNLNPTVAFAIQSVLILIVSWSAVAFQGKFGELAQIDGKIWIYLITAGVITTLSSLFTFHALKLSNSSVASPITNLSLVFAIIFAAIFLKEKLNWQLIVGASLMAIGAIIIALGKSSS